jgi:hypothetical protein
MARSVLRIDCWYSKMLYAVSESERKQRVTFRVGSDLVRALRLLPNQTAFVEQTLREALGRLCPLCHGTGQASDVRMVISDFKEIPIGPLDRASAEQLKALVRLGRQLLATQLELNASPEGGELDFRLAREDQILLAGRIPRGEPGPRLTH